MNRWIALLVIPLILPRLAFVADTTPRTSVQTAAEQAVEARSRAWVKAALAGNADAFRSFMTQDYVLLYVDPKTDKHPAIWVAKTGEEWAESLRSGKHKYDLVELRNTKVRLNGDVATFAGEYTENGVEDGKKYSESGLFVETWVKRGGQWFAANSVFP